MMPKVEGRVEVAANVRFDSKTLQIKCTKVPKIGPERSAWAVGRKRESPRIPTPPCVQPNREID
jgi:hypothetical protein